MRQRDGLVRGHAPLRPQQHPGTQHPAPHWSQHPSQHLGHCGTPFPHPSGLGLLLSKPSPSPSLSPSPPPVPPCGMSFIPRRPLHLLCSAALARCPGFIVQIFQQSQRGDPAAAHPGAAGTALRGLGADGCSIPAGGPERSHGCAHRELPRQCPPVTSNPAGPQFGAAFMPRSCALTLPGLWGDNSPPRYGKRRPKAVPAQAAPHQLLFQALFLPASNSLGRDVT